VVAAVLTILAASLGHAIRAAPVSGQIGIVGGANRDDVGDFVTADGLRLAGEVDGFHAGIFLSFQRGRFGARPAILYRQLRGAFVDTDLGAIDVEIIEIPLDLRVTAPLPVVRPYLVAGPVIMFPSSARPAAQDALANTRFRFDIGAGIEWNVGFRLWPEIRYGTVIGSLLRSDVRAAGQGSSRMSTFMLRLGISF
jgi:hypothetical protein